MTDSLKIRTDRSGQERAVRSVMGPMTCDIPVFRDRFARSATVDTAGCLTTGRSPRTHRRAAGRGANEALPGGEYPAGARSSAASAACSNAVRPNTSGSNAAHSRGPRSAAGTARRYADRRPAGPEVGRRRRWAAGLLLGVGCAIVVAVLGIGGEDYSDAVTGSPASTQVVHVRSGESLMALAARIAPEQPASAVIATVRELNDLQSAGLRPGQALLVPAYR